MSALKAALQKEMYAALEETTNQSFQDLQDNVRQFYSVPEARYRRTKQLMNSPQLDGISFNGDSAVSQISINTGTQYDPAGRDTATIYSYAEDGGLLGKGGFFERTKENIEKNIQDAFGKHFNK